MSRGLYWLLMSSVKAVDWLLGRSVGRFVGSFLVRWEEC